MYMNCLYIIIYAVMYGQHIGKISEVIVSSIYTRFATLQVEKSVLRTTSQEMLKSRRGKFSEGPSDSTPINLVSKSHIKLVIKKIFPLFSAYN